MRLLSLAVLACIAAFAAAAAAPYHLRLSLGPNQDKDIVFGWTVDGVTDVATYGPYVQYRPVGAPTWTYSTANCVSKRYTEEQTHFYCTVTNFAPNLDIEYLVGGKPSRSLSGLRNFRSAPVPGSSVKMAVMGDLGYEIGGPTGASLAAHALKKDYSLVVHVGDIAYADTYDKKGPNLDYELWNDRFMGLVEPTTSRVPYMLCPGNHDVTCHFDGDHDCAPNLTNFSYYRNRWHMPSAATDGPSDTGLWYTYTHGDIQFVSINTESDYPNSPFNKDTPTSAGGFAAPMPQMEWLAAKLAQFNTPEARALRPWVIVVGHRPVYSTLTLDYPPNFIETVRVTFEQLFAEHNVDLYISGHAHYYERTLPINNFAHDENYDNVNKPVYIINGAAGNEEGHCTDVTPELPSYMPYRNYRQYGFGVITTSKPTEGEAHTALLRRAARASANRGDVARVASFVPTSKQADRASGDAKNTRLTRLSSLARGAGNAGDVSPKSAWYGALPSQSEFTLSEAELAAAARRADAAAEAAANADLGARADKRALCYEFRATTVDQGPLMEAVDSFCIQH